MLQTTLKTEEEKTSSIHIYSDETICWIFKTNDVQCKHFVNAIGKLDGI